MSFVKALESLKSGHMQPGKEHIALSHCGDTFATSAVFPFVQDDVSIFSPMWLCDSAGSYRKTCMKVDTCRLMQLGDKFWI